MISYKKQKAAYKVQHKHKNNNKFHPMTKYCYLSDEIDELSILYYKVIQATRAFNSVFSIQMSLWMFSQLVILLLQNFHQYVGIVQLIMHPSTFLVIQNLSIFGAIFLTSYDIFSTCYACDTLLNEVSRIIETRTP